MTTILAIIMLGDAIVHQSDIFGLFISSSVVSLFLIFKIHLNSNSIDKLKDRLEKLEKKDKEK
jgi:hypothetical protein